MYEAYWGLKEKPFENTPDSRFLYHSEDSDDVFTRLLYTLKGNRGAALLTGESGCGKTLMARALVQELYPVNTEIALLTNPSWSADPGVPKSFSGKYSTSWERTASWKRTLRSSTGSTKYFMEATKPARKLWC